jgi:hypothetical protein
VTRDRAFDPVLGWRIWRVHEGLLRAVVWDVVWLPQVRFDAVCEDTPSPFSDPGHEHHFAPQVECDCGVYAYKSRDDAELYAREKVNGDVIAIGRVSLWGRVIEAERGYRGERAYPYELELLGGSHVLAAELRDRYAVDVSTGPAVVPLHLAG